MIVKDKIEELRASGKLQYILMSIVCALIIVGIGSLLAFNTTDKKIDNEEIRLEQEKDYIDIGKIMEAVNKDVSNIFMASNEKSEQGDILLHELGIDIKEVDAYAVSVDVKQLNAHAMAIIEPKKGEYKEQRRKLMNYIADKQSILLEANMGGSLEYQRAVNALIYEQGDYIILVMCDNSLEVITKLSDTIDNEIKQVHEREKAKADKKEKDEKEKLERLRVTDVD